MDILTLLGVLIGFAAILGGNFLEGGSLAALFNLPALIIVVGGTLGAAILQTPKPVFRRSLQMSSWIITPPAMDFEKELNKIVSWARLVRRDGLLGLESLSNAEKNSFAQKGLHLLVDGNEPEKIRSVLEVELISRERADFEAAKVYESMGGYAPTIGIIGAVMGLIHVMENLAEPDKLGAGIAVAFVATIYGVGLANLLLLPLASKIRSYVRQSQHLNEMIMEGILSIAEGENPRTIVVKLRGFYDH